MGPSPCCPTYEGKSSVSDTPNLAAPDTLLGMLQRGRGKGYLPALKAPPEEVWPLLYECITHNPKVDSDCEDREEYYASLITAMQIGVHPLHAWLKENHASTEDLATRPPLPLTTLGHLAERHNPEAVGILRDYVTYGRDWVDALRMLTTVDPLSADLDRLLLDRISSDGNARNRFVEGATGVWRWHSRTDHEGRTLWLHPECEPWKSLCQKNPELSAFFDGLEFDCEEDDEPFVDPSGFSVKELFAFVTGSNFRASMDALAGKVSVTDEALLLDNLESDDRHRVLLAFHGLACLGTPSAFEIVRSRIETNKRPERGAFDAIADMPGSLTLETARQWFRREERRFHYPAGLILVNHATLDDIPLLLEALRTPETLQHLDFRLSNTLEALARFDGYGHIPELEQIFCETGDCFDRQRAAVAMEATASELFRCQYAFECLWDCHWHTRTLGCETVTLSTAGAPARLQEIASDPLEDDEVRQAAQARLEELNGRNDDQ
jgi:hypothetical protein